jgi:hypothetical protein
MVIDTNQVAVTLPQVLSNSEFAPAGFDGYPFLDHPELEFSGVKAHAGRRVDEPFMSDIGGLCRWHRGADLTIVLTPIFFFRRASTRLMNQWAFSIRCGTCR